MNDNFIIITIDGIDYYIQADRLQDLNFINNKLVNTSNSSITLVRDFAYDATYPRINCNAMSQCILRQSYSSNYFLVSSNYVTNKDFNLLQLGQSNILSLIFYTLFMFLGFKLIFKR